MSDADLGPYKNANTVIEWRAKKIKSLPNLNKLQFEEDQGPLAEILQKAGRNVEDFFRNFPNTTSEERVSQQHFWNAMILLDQAEDRFNYLLLAHQSGYGLALKEYRTDTEGSEASVAENSKFMRTQGFASAPLHFHPMYQQGEQFRYLGRETMQGHETAVVAFAQRPDNVKIVNAINNAGNPVALLVQGVAWIDSETWQIVRMDTFLLAPRSEIALNRVNTSIIFGEVHFTDMPNAEWLPEKVTVDIQWHGHVFRNVHQYSHYMLFKAQAVEHR